MTRIQFGLLLTLLLGLTAGPTLAAFENLDISPRARGMGDSGVAVAGDAFAPYFNPAGMLDNDGPALGTSFLRPYGLSFADLIYFGGVMPFKAGQQAIGFGIRRFAVSYDADVPAALFPDTTPDDGGEVELMAENTFTVSHSVRLYEDLHSSVTFGSSLNIYHLKFGESVGLDGYSGAGVDPGSDIAAGLDFGLLVTLHERTRLGAMVKNLNNPQIGLDEEELKQRIHGGIAYEPYLGVVTTFEFENVLGEEVQYHGGIEMMVFEQTALRFGALTNPNKMTAGFGVWLDRLVLNYGFSTGGGTLDSSHQLGVSFSWGGEAQ